MTTVRLTWSKHAADYLGSRQEIREEWDRLNRARGNLPFLAADAIVIALSVFGTGQEKLFIGRRADGSTAALFVLVPNGKLRWQTFQPSQVPLGAWVADSQIPLLDAARSLLRGALGLGLVLSITQIDPLFTPRQEDAPDCRHDDYIDTGWIDISGSYEDYWAARGKNLRQNMRKQRAKLESEGIRTEMRILRDRDAMAQAIARYGALESAGWKAAQGTAVHADNDQGRFYRELLENAATRNEAVVYEYCFDNRVVAINLCLERDGVLVVLKTSYDESIKSFSPAFLLRQDELELLHREATTRRLEYYGRLMEWHTRWTENKRTIYHLTLYRWPMIKTLSANRRSSAAKTVTPAGAESAPKDDE